MCLVAVHPSPFARRADYAALVLVKHRRNERNTHTHTPPKGKRTVIMVDVPFTEEDLHELYMWVDEIPISRPKRNIARDFSDGCCVAEIVKFFFPKLVELHNYTPSLARNKKLDNWATLNAKVFRKLYFEVPQEEVEDIINAVPGAIERFLRALRTKIAQIKARREEVRAAASGEAPYPPQAALYGTRGGAGDVPRPSVGVKTPSARPSSSKGRQQQQQQPTFEEDVYSAAPPPLPNDPAYNGAGDRGVEETVRQLIEEKDRTIMELRETVGILSEKIRKLEELVRVKDDKLSQYRTKFGRV